MTPGVLLLVLGCSGSIYRFKLLMFTDGSTLYKMVPVRRGWLLVVLSVSLDDSGRF